MRQTWVTTEDNPFDPFEQFDDWDRYDRDSGYHTCRYIAGLAQTSSALSEAENEAFFYRLGIGDGLRLKKAFRKQSNALEMTDSCFTSPRIFHISIVTVENS